MKLKFFNVPVLDSSQSKEALNKFYAAHSVNHAEKHFVADSQNSFWAIAVTYDENEL